MKKTQGKSELVPYDVYLDESFHRFWGFEHPEGNFCYAVLGIPRQHAPMLKEFHKDLLTEFQTAVRNELQVEPPPELKSHVLRRLPFNVRRRLTLRLRNFMRDVNAFLLAEFTEVRGFVLDRIRSDFAQQGQDRLPDDWERFYEQRRKDLVDLVRQGKKGQGPILKALVGTPFAGLGYYMARLAKEYQVFFDPRQPREDADVADSIREFTETVLRGVHREEPNQFKGVCGDYGSEEVPGLQLADLLVGEVRHWFVSHPEFLRFESGPQLVTEKDANATFLLTTAAGYVPKKQRNTKLPLALMKRLTRVDEHSLLPFFRNLLAKDLLSCVAHWGEFRHINFKEGYIIDSLDDWEAA